MSMDRDDLAEAIQLRGPFLDPDVIQEAIDNFGRAAAECLDERHPVSLGVAMLFPVDDSTVRVCRPGQPDADIFFTASD